MFHSLKVFTLMAGLTALFVVVGGAIGGQQGAIFALLLAAAMNFFAYFNSGKAALRAFQARIVSREEAPELHDMVDQMVPSLDWFHLAGDMVPSLDWLLYAFLRKEAVVSSQIEGTQATLIDLLEFEAQGEGEPNADVEEVCNYLEALKYARAELADPKGLPLSIRLLNETHRRPLSGACGSAKLPGEARRSQNWIGGTRPGTPRSYLPRPTPSAGSSGTSRSTSTGRTRCRPSCGRASSTSSSRRSTPISTATDASADCSSPSSWSARGSCRSPSSI